MRIESSVTAISWIPSEAITGLAKLPFEIGITHYDAPPPDVVDDVEALRVADGFRFANELRAFVDVKDGRIVAYGHLGGGQMGATRVRLGRHEVTFVAARFPELRPAPVVGERSVRFLQTVGGRTGLPAPRRVRGRPFVKLDAPTVWTTLALTIHADGTSKHELVGASPFPRHWIYDPFGRLVAKSGVTDFETWYREAFGRHTPWGNQDSPALVSEVETALERQLSVTILRGGAKPAIRRLETGATLVEQGEWGDELYLLLDGLLAVEVDDDVLAELGPGAILGERALVEGGRRTSTLRAVSPCRIAAVSGERLDKVVLAELASGHRREEG